MRKSFKIKNLIRNNRYAFLSRGEEKNLLANEMSLQILGGGWTSPLLHSWGALKKYGARLMCGSNEPTPTRISKFAGSLRNSALPLGEGQTKSGGHSPLLHSGCPLQPNMPRSVIPQRFRCIPEGVGALRVDTVHFYTLDIRENPTCLSTSSRNGKECVKRALLPCGISKENCCGMTT